MKKPKLQSGETKTVSTSLGASASTSSKKSPLMPKKDYSKGKKQEDMLHDISFGQTGLTGET